MHRLSVCARVRVCVCAKDEGLGVCVCPTFLSPLVAGTPSHATFSSMHSCTNLNHVRIT